MEGLDRRPSPDTAVFLDAVAREGVYVFHGALDAHWVARLRADCLRWVERCGAMQVASGALTEPDTTAHHAIGAGDGIDAFVDAHLFHPYLQAYFGGGPYILHACNPVSGAPHRTTYVHKIHRDTRTFIPGYHFRMNMLVALDDFTVENGATEYLPGSQRDASEPDASAFDRGLARLLIRAGDVVLFDSYRWHRAGRNRSDALRVALTLSFGPPFVKPQLDYARMLGESYGAGLSALSRQVLGYNARVPVSHQEWYQPPERRLYRADQG